MSLPCPVPPAVVAAQKGSKKLVSEFIIISMKLLGHGSTPWQSAWGGRRFYSSLLWSHWVDESQQIGVARFPVSLQMEGCSFPLFQKQSSQSQTSHINGFFHMLRPKSLKELLEIEGFLTCLGKLCLVLYSTVLPMFVRTPEVVSKKHHCPFLFNSVRKETVFKADLQPECPMIPVTIRAESLPEESRWAEHIQDMKSLTKGSPHSGAAESLSPN